MGGKGFPALPDALFRRTWGYRADKIPHNKHTAFHTVPQDLLISRDNIPHNKHTTFHIVPQQLLRYSFQLQPDDCPAAFVATAAHKGK